MVNLNRSISQRIEALASTWMRGGHRALQRGDLFEAARCFEKARYWSTRQHIHGAFLGQSHR